MAVPKTLAIDYGTKRVGIAVSHASLAEPLTIVPHDKQLFQNIQQLLEEHAVKQVVIGLSENTMAEKTRAFATELQSRIEQPVEFADETLTSQQVQGMLRQRGMKHSKRHGPIDHYAAALILQEWLEGR